MAQLRHLASGADIFFANLFDKSYARDVGGTTGEHAYPELFHADTPCGTYQGVTDQVVMTATPGHSRVPLVPRGSSRPEWATRPN